MRWLPLLAALARADDDDAPTATPTTSFPTILVPDSLWPESNATLCQTAKAHEVGHCYHHNGGGVCVNDGAECDALGGTFKNGSGYGRGCSCCADVGFAYPSPQPSAYPTQPTSYPTHEVPESLWPETNATLCDAAKAHQVGYCWHHNDGGVCVNNGAECDVLGGEFKNGSGCGAARCPVSRSQTCGAPAGSGCSCCANVQFAWPSPEPTMLRTSSKKKKKEIAGLRPLYFYLALVAVLVFTNVCTALLLCVHWRSATQSDRELLREHRRNAKGDKIVLAECALDGATSLTSEWAQNPPPNPAI